MRSCTPRAVAESWGLEAGALPELSLLGPLPLVAMGLVDGMFPDGASGLEPVGFPALSGMAVGSMSVVFGLLGFDPGTPVSS